MKVQLLFLAVLLSLPVSLHAQTSWNNSLDIKQVAIVSDAKGESVLSGFIRDQLGEVLIGAQISLEGRCFTKHTKTDMFGRYEFNNLPSGVYTIKVIHDQYIGKKQMIKLTQYQSGKLSMTLDIDPAQMIMGVTVWTDSAVAPKSIPCKA